MKLESDVIDTIKLKLLSKYFCVNRTVMDERFLTTKYSYNMMMHHILLQFEFWYLGQMLKMLIIILNLKQVNFSCRRLNLTTCTLYNYIKFNNAEIILSSRIPTVKNLLYF